MRQAVLAVVLIALPVAVFVVGLRLTGPGDTGAAGAGAGLLGDLSAFAAITADVREQAGAGNLAAAATRITDLETAWDDAQPALQKAAPEAWGVVDGAIDAALKALRAASPDAGQVTAALTGLAATLDDPRAAGGSGGAAVLVSGIAVTDGNGHALPCETLIASVRDTLAATVPPADAAAEIADLQARALERCTADDDSRANGFSAQALALLAPKVTP